MAFAFLFPCAGLLARLLGGAEPLVWPLLLFAGLAVGWTFRFIYDFESLPDSSRCDPLLRALAAVWILAAALAVVRARTLWALRQGLAGRAANGSGLLDSVATRESLLTLAGLLAGAGLFFILRRSGDTVRRQALRAALVGIAASAAAALLQRAGILPPESQAFWKLTGRFSGGAMDPNALGLLCAMGIAVLAGLLVAGERPRTPAAVGLLLVAAGLLLSGSRSGLLIPLLGLPAVFLRRGRAGGRVPLALGAAVVGALALMLWVAPRWGIAPGRLSETFDPTLPLQYRVSERPVLWRSAARLFRRSPVEGAGLGAFSWTLPDLLRESHERLPVRDNPGSAYVQALAETGIVGFALTLGLALSLGRRALGRGALVGGAPLGAAAAVLGFLVALCVGSHWLAPDVCLFFFLLASLVAPAAASPPSRALRLLLAGAVGVYAAAAAIAAMRTDRPSVTFRHDRLAGFHAAEARAGAPFRWTKRTFGIWLAPGDSRILQLVHYPPDDQPVEIESLGHGGRGWRGRLKPGESVRLRLTASPRAPRAVLFRVSRTFVLKRLGISGDRRELGVVALLPD